MTTESGRSPRRLSAGSVPDRPGAATDTHTGQA
jgi:hypothetical protein